jgi:hypothetical protein
MMLTEGYNLLWYNNVQSVERLCLPPAFTLVCCWTPSSTPKMEAVCSSETLVDFQRTTQRYFPSFTLHHHRCENVESLICCRFFITSLFCTWTWLGNSPFRQSRSSIDNIAYSQSICVQLQLRGSNRPLCSVTTNFPSHPNPWRSCKGKVASVVKYLSTTPWKRMG